MPDPMAAKSARLARVESAYAARIAATIDAALGRARDATLAALAAGAESPDPRRSIRRSPGRKDAARAVAGLADDLAGLIGDARDAIYSEASDAWSGLIPPEYLASGNTATPTRDIPINGYRPIDFLAGPIGRATRRLDAIGGNVRSVETWREQSRRAILANARTLLSDSAVAVDMLAGRDRTDPAYLD